MFKITSVHLHEMNMRTIPTAKLLKIVQKLKHFPIFFVYNQVFLYFCAHNIN